MKPRAVFVITLCALCYYPAITLKSHTFICPSISNFAQRSSLSLSLSQAEFLQGKSYYSDDSFGLAANHFEGAVEEYFTADKECKAMCEGAYNYDGYNYMEYSADLFQTMTGETVSPSIGGGGGLCREDLHEVAHHCPFVRPLHAGAEL